MKTCPDCGCRVYRLGCVNCDEDKFIAEQEILTELYGNYEPPKRQAAPLPPPQAVPQEESPRIVHRPFSYQAIAALNEAVWEHEAAQRVAAANDAAWQREQTKP